MRSLSISGVDMVLDVIKGYLQVAEGLSDVAMQRVREFAETLTTSGMEATAKSQEQLQEIGDELAEASRTNMDLLTGLVRTEVDRAVGRLGFVREEELAAVRGHVQRLEEQLRKEHQRATDRATGAVMTAADVSQTAAKSAVEAASATVSGVTGAARSVIGRAAGETPAKPVPEAATVAPVQRPPATKTAAKKTAAKKTSAKKTSAKKAAGEEPVTVPAESSTTGQQAPAKATTKQTAAKATAKKAPAKKAVTKATAKKTPAEAPAKKAVTKATAKKTPPTKATAKKTTA